MISKSKIKKLIRESNLIEGYDDPKMDAQSLVAWEFLQDVALDQLSHSCIMRVQKIITLTQTDLLPNQRGYYRGMAGNDINVKVGNHTPPNYSMVKFRMANWVMDQQDEESKWNHYLFEDIHPFVDGNGRTGRMIMWWQQDKRGEEPWLILAKDRQAYYDWLNECRLKVAGI